MRTRIHDWHDVKYDVPKYSFQVWSEKGKKWINVLDENGACIYDTPEERDKKRAEVRKKKIII